MDSPAAIQPKASFSWRTLVAVLVSAMLTASLCLLLYLYDNKYTHPASQPINGVLLLSQEELEATPIRYLVREWVFYPGQLLTPGEEPQGYRRHVFIGQLPHLRLDANYGSGSYRLQLQLPEQEQLYALEMPEVFSSYRLYCNDSLLVEMGQIDPAHYQDELGGRLVTFSAAGTVELLLTVSDFSGVYSGLTYPPAFGQVQAVLAAREWRLLLHGAGVILALLGAVLSLVFGLRSGLRRGLMLALSCLLFAILTGYPLYHGLWSTAYQPWYTLEITSFYALLLLALLIQCDLYGLWNRKGLLLVLPCALGFFSALVRSSATAYLPGSVGVLFSLFSAVLKYYSAGCLILLSGWALRRGRVQLPLLLCGSISLGICLIFDRLLPNHEPIYGGWFSEVGGLLLVLSLVASLWLDAVEGYRFRLVYARVQDQLALQLRHYDQLSTQVRLARQHAHDLRHHARALHAMAQQGNLPSILSYLETYVPHLQSGNVSSYSAHPVADAILSHYAKAANALGAQCDLHLPLPVELSLPGDELCVLLANLLENAVEALSQQQLGTRFLRLRGELLDHHLTLLVENSFDGTRAHFAGRYASTKAVRSGLGLHSVEAIVQKYEGTISVWDQEQVFSVALLLQLPE